MNEAIETKPVMMNHINFDGDQIGIVEKDSHHFVALKPICEAIGIEWKNHHRTIQEDLVLNSTVFTTTIVAQDGKQREMVCLPLEYLNGWLFKINPVRYEGECRERIIRYQKECYRVLFKHFFPPTKEYLAQLKQRVTAKRLELDLIKAKTAMKKEAANAAERIYFGNDTIEELDQCPELQAMTKSFLENLNKDDLFPNDQENAN